MGKSKAKAESGLEKLSLKFTDWVGTPTSIILHTIFFIGIFGLRLLGIGTDSILLILTTAVSLEAIYLAIFIQMSVNRHGASLKSVEEDIDEIQEDVEDLQEDVEDIQEDEREDDLQDKQTVNTLNSIEGGLQKLLAEVEELKKRNESRSL
jgi:low affinity Fe/Cu permease